MSGGEGHSRYDNWQCSMLAFTAAYSTVSKDECMNTIVAATYEPELSAYCTVVQPEYRSLQLYHTDTRKEFVFEL